MPFTVLRPAEFDLAGSTPLEMGLAPQGPAGVPGVSAGMQFTFDTATTDADPGAGELRLNNATPASATAVYIDNTDRFGTTITTWLDALDDGGGSANRGRLRIAERAEDGNYVEYQITGSVVDGTGYRKITVSHISGAPTFIAGLALMVFGYSKGQDGTSFPTGGAEDDVLAKNSGVDGDADFKPIADLSFLADTDDGTSAVSLRGRFSSSIDLEEYGWDRTGTVANGHTALMAAVAAAQAKGRPIDIVGRGGILNLGGTASFSHSGHRLRVIFENTRAKKDSGTGNWFTVGTASPAARSRRFTIQGLESIPDTTQTADAIFNFVNCGDFQVVGCPILGCLTGYKMGVGAAVDNDVIYVDIVDSPVVLNTNAAAIAIQLGSGAFLNVKGGGRWNGAEVSGQRMIKQTHTTRRWDGAYIIGQAAEGFDKYLEVTGFGLSNMTWTGGQVDGYSIAFDTSNIASGGSCQNWNLVGVQGLLGAYFINWAVGSGAAQRGLLMSACHIVENTESVLIGASVHANITGNHFENSGKGNPLVIFGGKGVVNSNTSEVHSGTAHTHGIEWSGSSDPDRSATGNEWDNASAGDETGTA